MEFKDAVALVHFRELHFLPRVIFSLGAIFLIGSFFVKSFILGLFGVGVIFAGSALNLFLTAILVYKGASSRWSVPWMLLFQFLIAFVLAFGILQVSYHFYRYGDMPTCLQPVN